MQISRLEISIKYLKILVREITNIDNILESAVVILVSRPSDTSDFPESAAVSSVRRPSDTKPQASDTWHRQTEDLCQGYTPTKLLEHETGISLSLIKRYGQKAMRRSFRRPRYVWVAQWKWSNEITWLIEMLHEKAQRKRI